jgi:hypothetical protein
MINLNCSERTITAVITALLLNLQLGFVATKPLLIDITDTHHVPKGPLLKRAIDITTIATYMCSACDALAACTHAHAPLTAVCWQKQLAPCWFHNIIMVMLFP